MKTNRFLQFGLVFLCFYVVLIPYQYIPISPMNMKGLIGLGVRILPAFLSFLLFGVWIVQRRYFAVCERLPPGSSAILSLVVFHSVGLIGALNPLIGMSRLVYYTITGVCLYFVANALFATRTHVHTMIKVVVGLALVVAGLGVLEFVMQENLLFSGIFDANNMYYSQFTSEKYDFRILSTLGHPVFLAGLLVLFFPFLLYAFENAAQKYSRIFYAGTLVVAFSAIFLTFSRGGWLAFLFSLLIYYASKLRTLIATLICGAVITASFMSIPSVRGFVSERNSYNTYMREVEVGGRIHSYKVVSSMVLNFPFWGLGTAHYRFMANRFGDYDDTPDNAYLMILAEGGLVGSVLLVIVLFRILGFLFEFSSYTSKGSFVLPEPGRRLTDAFLASMTGFLIDAVTCDVFHFPVTRLLFWIIAGCGVGSIRVFTGDKQCDPC